MKAESISRVYTALPCPIASCAMEYSWPKGASRVHEKKYILRILFYTCPSPFPPHHDPAALQIHPRIYPFPNQVLCPRTIRDMA